MKATTRTATIAGALLAAAMTNGTTTGAERRDRWERGPGHPDRWERDGGSHRYRGERYERR